jgi:hypothetical protein
MYRPRHPERTVLYRVMFHHFERFLTEYESRFEREYGYFRPVVKEVVERYLDYGNPRCGFARIRCPDCAEERLVMFSCRTRGFCPSYHAKRILSWPNMFGDRCRTRGQRCVRKIVPPRPGSAGPNVPDCLSAAVAALLHHRDNVLF